MNSGSVWPRIWILNTVAVWFSEAPKGNMNIDALMHCACIRFFCNLKVAHIYHYIVSKQLHLAFLRPPSEIWILIHCCIIGHVFSFCSPKIGGGVRLSFDQEQKQKIDSMIMTATGCLNVWWQSAITVVTLQRTSSSSHNKYLQCEFNCIILFFTLYINPFCIYGTAVL